MSTAFEGNSFIYDSVSYRLQIIYC
uniref:Uncharacterized protein n=1 Tax=Rhizophora mucronata TaxID=61149 RepID=A0A2P2QEP2_RHIMU